MSRHRSFPSVLCFGLCLSLLLNACAPEFQEAKVANIPVTLLIPGTQEVNLDTALAVATQTIKEVLPDAYFEGMVFSGKCEALLQLQGKVVLAFDQVRLVPLKWQVVSGVASIDTIKQTMDLYYKDESDYALYIPQRAFVGDSHFKQIAALAYKHITELGLSDCDVTLTQLDNSWRVRCGPLDNFIQKCLFDIADGVIRETPK